MKTTPANTKKAKLYEDKLPQSVILDAESLTESAAVACHNWIGKGQEKEADQAAVSAMRDRFHHVAIDGTVVIGEGERDEAPMLYIGERVGMNKNHTQVDIAVDPLEGTTLCAHAMPNSISVMAIAPRGTLLHAPDIYMDKIAVGPGLKGVVDLDNALIQNLKNLAKAKGCLVSDLRVCILKRPRHEELVAKVREAGARVQFITDGDVTAAIATCLPETKIDLYLGIGGAPEGVLAAAALKCLGGTMQCRLVYKDEAEKERARKLGITDLDFKYNINDMVKSDAIFSATGVTDGWLLKGVKFNNDSSSIASNSLIMHAATGSIHHIQKTISAENYLEFRGGQNHAH